MMRARGRFRLLVVALAALTLYAGSASADPKEPTDDQSSDARFAKSFVGKFYEDELDIEGWTDMGGGLVTPPIYVRQYQREDGTFLVLTSRELAKASKAGPASYEVADALIVPPLPKDVQFTISCVQAPDETLRFMGEARGPESLEWWTDVRRAWEISAETGQISTVKAKGIRCTNISWGQ